MEQNIDKSLVRKNMRWGEWFIEKTVATVASFSIVLIFLIFIFVFRESLPLLSSLTISDKVTEQTPESTSASKEARDDLQPERYNPEVYNLGSDAQKEGGELAPESYDPNAPESYDPNAPESYDPNTPESHDPNAPESYNPNAEPTGEESSTTTTEPEPVYIEHESVSLSNMVGTSWQPVSEHPKFGISTLLIGTAKTTIVAILFGAPLGILAALYTAFFAKRWVREIVKPVIEILAGFPSVVVGFFCLMSVGSITQALFGLDFRLNAFVGGIGLGIAVIPIVFTITEDALSAVPRALREASLAVGATEWETAYRVMLPAAFPGVFAAVLLGIGRAFGETMIALMATGNAALFSFDVFDPVRTFAATIGAEMGEVVWGSTHYSMLFFLGVLLFIFTFTLNTITELFIKERLLKKFQGN